MWLPCDLALASRVMLGAFWVASTAVAAEPSAASQVAAPAAPSPSVADQTVVLSGPAGQVTLADVRAMAWVVVPAEQHANLLGRKTGIEQLALAVYTQMALAQQAKQAGLTKDPVFQRAEELAARRTLSEIWMARQADAKAPTAAQAEQYARTQFEQEKHAYASKPQVHVRHLLVGVGGESGRTQAQALKQAEALLARVKAGERLADLAPQLSDDKGSAERGGELAAFEEGRMVPEFEEAAFALEKPGQLAGPVKTRFGYHLIELIEKKAGQPARFEDLKEELVKQALQQRRQQIRREVWDAAQKGLAFDEAAIEAWVRQAGAAQPGPAAKP